MATSPIYAFNGEQLTRLLEGTVEMFLEYRDQHGRDEAGAKDWAVLEMLQGLDADQELNKDERSKTTLQLSSAELYARVNSEIDVRFVPTEAAINEKEMWRGHRPGSYRP